MKTITFKTEWKGNRNLAIPNDVLPSLPSSGKATVWICMDIDAEDRPWHEMAYTQFLRDDSPEDAVYDKYR